MRTIHVTGEGSLKVHPDTTRITADLEGQYDDYGEALRHSAEDTEKLKDALSAIGFDRSDLKTLSFSIDTVYERYKYRNEYKQRLVGYKYYHKLKLEFGSDNDRLGRTIHALTKCAVTPEIHISYTVKDPEACKDELLARTIADAAKKAAILAAGAGCELKGVQSIDYSWRRMRFDYSPMDRLYLDKMVKLDAKVEDTCDIDLEPDDIDLSDSVTVEWEIE